MLVSFFVSLLVADVIGTALAIAFVNIHVPLYLGVALGFGLAVLIILIIAKFKSVNNSPSS